ncbi:MAG: DUF374 domain-containing protein [Myxococcota bacterium]
MATSRVRVQGPFGEGPAIYAHWHQHLPLLLPLCGRLRCWLLMSTAPRMAPIARWTRLLGLRLVRGASGEGGRAALPALADALSRGESVELAVDGPQGPAFQAKPGCVELALETGAPLIALAYSSRTARSTPGRWDQQLLVRPFSEVTVLAVLVPRTPEDTREELLARVQQILTSLRDVTSRG